MNKLILQKGIFITGTDTDVGKTYIGTQIVALLHDNRINAVPRKPIESGCLSSDEDLIPDDASKYFAAANQIYPLNDICPFRFEPAISPQRAARLVNQPVYLQEAIEACTKNLADNDYLVIEGAGGFYSPLCEDGKNADLAEKLSLPILLVASDQLGCINHILLTTEAIHHRGLALSAVVLNQQHDGHDENMNNLEDLKNLLDVPVFSITKNEKIKKDSVLIELITGLYRS